MDLVENLSKEFAKPVILVLDPTRRTKIPAPDSDNKESYRRFLKRKFDILEVGSCLVVGYDWNPSAVLLNRRNKYEESAQSFASQKDNRVFTLDSYARFMKLKFDFPAYFDRVWFAVSKSALSNQSSILGLSAALGLSALKNNDGYTFSADPAAFRKILVKMAIKRRIDPRGMDEPEDYDYARAIYASLNDDQITQMVLSPSRVFTADVLVTSPLMTAGRQKFEAFARDNPRADASSHAAIVKAYLNGIDFDNPRGMVEWWLAELPQFRMRGKDPTHWYSL